MKTLSLLFCIISLSVAGFSQSCLVADYPFSGNANDVSGNGNNAVVYGATITEDRFGSVNSAYLFDGIDDFIDTESSFDFNFRTISIWAQVNQLGQPMRIVEMDAQSLTYGAVGITVNANGSLTVNAGGSAQVLSNTVNTGEWNHYVLVRNGNQGSFYLNGQLVANLNTSGNGSSTNPNPDLLIGTWRTEDDRFFNGKIDDIKIFDCVLSPQEIQELFNDTISCEYASFPLDGNGNDTIQGLTATIYGASSDTSRLGVLNGAFYFDGENDYMDTEESFDFNYRTFSVWAKADSIGKPMRILEMDAAALKFGAVGITIDDNGAIIANPGGSAINIANISVQPGQWNHYALVRDDGVGKFYFNGQLAAQVSTTGNGSNSAPNPNLLLGTWRSADSRFFNGSIDDLLIYKCALTDQEIQDLYNTTPSGFGSRRHSEGLSLYPNPVSSGNILHIDIPEQYASETLDFRLVDIQGRNIMTGQVVLNQIELASSLPEGIYVLILSFDGNKSLNQKLIIH